MRTKKSPKMRPTRQKTLRKIRPSKPMSKPFKTKVKPKSTSLCKKNRRLKNLFKKSRKNLRKSLFKKSRKNPRKSLSEKKRQTKPSKTFVKTKSNTSPSPSSKRI